MIYCQSDIFIGFCSVAELKCVCQSNKINSKKSKSEKNQRCKWKFFKERLIFKILLILVQSGPRFRNFLGPDPVPDFEIFLGLGPFRSEVFKILLVLVPILDFFFQSLISQFCRDQAVLVRGSLLFVAPLLLWRLESNQNITLKLNSP